MTDLREVRAAAFEIKFVVPAALVPRLRHWARAHLDPDPHGSGPEADEYRTTSLYLDTAARDVLHRRGSYGRSKYRIRRYNDADTVFLERKLRQPAVLAKRRTRTSLDALSRLAAQPDGEVWAGGWFQRRLATRRLAPVCQVSYRRTARQKLAGAAIRLTLDEELSAQPIDVLAFTPAPGVPVLAAHAILELKFRRHVPAIFRRLVEEFALQPARASKYRLAMAGLLPAAAAPPPADEAGPIASGEAAHV